MSNGASSIRFSAYSEFAGCRRGYGEVNEPSRTIEEGMTFES